MRLPKSVFLAATFLFIVLLLATFAYGVVAERFRVFPYRFFSDVEAGLRWFSERQPGGDPWYYKATSKTQRIYDQRQSPRNNALNLMTSIGDNDRLLAQVIDMQGNIVQSWDLDWFSLWPDPQHVREADLPKSRPGGHIHGIQMLDDGSIVFNYEKLGMMRVGLCGEVIWRLPYRTHHSVFRAEDDTLWVPGIKVHENGLPDYPNHAAPVYETTVLNVSQDGKILREISVFDLLASNGLRAWLYMGAADKSNVVVGDELHLNDVEVFPSTLKSRLFSPGDIMLSLRNISTVLVFDPQTLKIKYWKTGDFVRQHDPDFIKGGKIAIFDNNHVGPDTGGQQSRIIILDPETDSTEIRYGGNDSDPFYTKIMGKQQWLKNGNVLLTDAVNGRAIEVNPDGKVVWEFVNIVADGKVGIVEKMQRLPEKFNTLFPANCAGRQTLQ